MIRSATIAATIFIGLAGSQAVAWDSDFFGQYLERKDTIVSGAGDARDVNAATHIIDPWRRNVGNRRIPANGERAAGAVERYRTNTPQNVPCTISPDFEVGSGIRSQTARNCSINSNINASTSNINASTRDINRGAGTPAAPR
jgi:hypothetical protein